MAEILVAKHKQTIGEKLARAQALDMKHQLVEAWDTIQYLTGQDAMIVIAAVRKMREDGREFHATI